MESAVGFTYRWAVERSRKPRNRRDTKVVMDAEGNEVLFVGEAALEDLAFGYANASLSYDFFEARSDIRMLCRKDMHYLEWRRKKARRIEVGIVLPLNGADKCPNAEKYDWSQVKRGSGRLISCRERLLPGDPLFLDDPDIELFPLHYFMARFRYDDKGLIYVKSHAVYQWMEKQEEAENVIIHDTSGGLRVCVRPLYETLGRAKQVYRFNSPQFAAERLSPESEYRTAMGWLFILEDSLRIEVDGKVLRTCYPINQEKLSCGYRRTRKEIRNKLRGVIRKNRKDLGVK